MKKRNWNKLKTWLVYHFPITKKMKRKTKADPFQLEPAEKILVQWAGAERPVIGLVKERPNASPQAYWPKFERFLKYNQLEYHIIDISSSTWIDQISSVDIIVWRPINAPAQLHEAKNKIYMAEQILGKTTFPSYRDLWLYEEKINQYYALKHHGLPTPKTFISHNLDETLEYLGQAEYPLVWKLNTGSAALGVKKINNQKSAVKLAKKVFGKGLKTYWGYEKQKDYVYLQEFIKDSEYDLRVITAGDCFFGFYRFTPANDFRASGARNLKKVALPEEALKLARDVQQKLGVQNIAVDMIKGGQQTAYNIIELSLFTAVITPEQLKVENVPGYYHYQEGQFVFKEGRYWIHDLMLTFTVDRWMEKLHPGSGKPSCF